MDRTDMMVGAVDIGTNTVRLLIADGSTDPPSEVERHSVVVGLGRGVDRARRFDPDAVERALAALGGFAEKMDDARVAHRSAVATSASRDAADADAFLDRVARVIGVRPRVISGDEEARLSFRGATRWLPGSMPVVVIDPGGGSTEFVFGGSRPDYLVSVDIGSVRLTDRLLPDRPATSERIAAAAAHVRDLFASVTLPGRPSRAVGVGGTFTTLAGIAAFGSDAPTVVDGRGMTQRALDGLVGALAGLSIEQTAAIPSLDPARAPAILGGAIVAAEAVRHVGIDAVTVSVRDLLDGVAMELASHG
ncbi:MAG TPA: Ppx/GppA phosphatase family protein [Acidimicrobiia bacterium]|nr:Ppx/GppA phosphatase family protein [Acidimicrobiia bacterium]